LIALRHQRGAFSFAVDLLHIAKLTTTINAVPNS